MPNQLYCPKCGGKSFSEWTHELAKQRDVILFDNGDRDYGSADTVENVGETISIEGYECDNCNIDFILESGKLIPVKEV